MDVLGIILVGAGVVALIAVFVWAYKTKGEGSMWKKIAAGAGALAAVLVGILLLGRKRKPKVVTIDGHKRTVAPSETDTARADMRAENLDERSEELEEEDEQLEEKSEDLDREKDELDARADATDQKLEEIESSSRDSGDDAGDAGDDQFDPDLARRLRES